MTILIESSIVLPPADSIAIKSETLKDKNFTVEFYEPAVRSKVTICGVPDEARYAVDLPGLEEKLEETISAHFAPIIHKESLFMINSILARAFQFGGARPC